MRRKKHSPRHLWLLEIYKDFLLTFEIKTSKLGSAHCRFSLRKSKETSHILDVAFLN